MSYMLRDHVLDADQLRVLLCAVVNEALAEVFTKVCCCCCYVSVTQVSSHTAVVKRFNESAAASATSNLISNHSYLFLSSAYTW